MFKDKEELKQFICETVIEAVKENGQLTQEISRSLVAGYEPANFDFGFAPLELESSGKELPSLFK